MSRFFLVIFHSVFRYLRVSYGKAHKGCFSGKILCCAMVLYCSSNKLHLIFKIIRQIIHNESKERCEFDIIFSRYSVLGKITQSAMSQYHHSYNYFHLLEGQNKYSNIYLLSGHQSVWQNTEPKDTDNGLNEVADCI